MLDPIPALAAWRMYLSPDGFRRDRARPQRRRRQVTRWATRGQAGARRSRAGQAQNGDGGPLAPHRARPVYSARGYPRMKLRVVADLNRRCGSSTMPASQRVVGRDATPPSVHHARGRRHHGGRLRLDDDLPRSRSLAVARGLVTAPIRRAGFPARPPRNWLDEALPLMTRNGAAGMGLGDRTGMLARSLSADFIVSTATSTRSSRAIAGTRCSGFSRPRCILPRPEASRSADGGEALSAPRRASAFSRENGIGGRILRRLRPAPTPTRGRRAPEAPRSRAPCPAPLCRRRRSRRRTGRCRARRRGACRPISPAGRRADVPRRAFSCNLSPSTTSSTAGRRRPPPGAEKVLK